jgi:drug/metabolite transporter (DMT)-like permease
MNGKRSFTERFKTDPIKHLIAFLTLLCGLLFFALQSSKLFRPEAAEAEMQKLPFGRYDWGYVWSDTLVAGPLFILGGILLLGRRYRLGRLLSFAGFAINHYATIFLIIGFRTVGAPLSPADWFLLIFFGILGLLCMIYFAAQALREEATGNENKGELPG